MTSGVRPTVPPARLDCLGLLALGRITGLHGLRGALRMTAHNPGCPSLTALKRLFIESGGTVREYQLAGVARAGRNRFKIMLAGITGLEQAELLKGGAVYAAQDDLPAPSAGEFYYFQAIGCEVWLTDGRRLGQIAEVFHTGANDVWVVREGDGEYLVPVIDDVVRSVDLAARRAIIEPIAGLLEEPPN